MQSHAIQDRTATRIGAGQLCGDSSAVVVGVRKVEPGRTGLTRQWLDTFEFCAQSLLVENDSCIKGLFMPTGDDIVGRNETGTQSVVAISLGDRRKELIWQP
jgi:hypothetical protein